MKKVLFLDIDGVLNCDTTKERCLRYIGVDKVLAKRFTDWLKANPEVAVVLSSTWRGHPEMYPCLRRAGIQWVSKTPHSWGQPRGQEIANWLYDHKMVEQYAILDDNSDMLDHQRVYFVQTNPTVGLQPDDLAKLSAILG